MNKSLKHHQIHLVLIDALNLIRRIEGGLQSIPGQAKVDQQQLVSLTQNALRKLIRGHQPSHLIAVFDGDGDNWRKQIYPQYKENRKAMSPELAHVLPAIKDAWQTMGAHIIQPRHDEADDVIATLAHKVRQHHQKNKCTIISTDQGYLQLLPQGVEIWDHFKQHWQDRHFTEHKFQVAPHQLLDYWAIVGQSGNKIPGVSGLGPKAALSILNQYGSLKDAFSSEDPEPNKRVIKLKESKKDAQLSYQLVRFKQNIMLGGTLSDYKYNPKEI